jgi:hypothetical protein
MHLENVQFIFNRAFSHTLSKKKLLGTSMVLLLCSLLIVFFRSLAMNAGAWMRLSLVFLPIFLCAGVLLAMGIILIRIYHDEVKQKPVKYWNIIYQSLDVVLGASYLSIPIILSYLLLWMLLGIFFLLNSIPGIGNFFGVILAFAPFLLNLGAILLCIVSVSTLFFVAPVIALKGDNRMQLAELVARRCKYKLFFNLLLATIAALPLILLGGVLTITAFITDATSIPCQEPLYAMIQWFIMMIPFAILSSPAVIFFFNFSAESYVLLQKSKKSESLS